MPKVPEINHPKFGDWIPDKQERYNMRFWKAKQARKLDVPHPDFKKAK